MSSMKEAGPEVSWEVIPRADTNDALAPDRATRCKVGTGLMAGKIAKSASPGAWQEWLSAWWAGGSRDIAWTAWSWEHGEEC